MVKGQGPMGRFLDDEGLGLLHALGAAREPLLASNPRERPTVQDPDHEMQLYGHGQMTVP